MQENPKTDKILLFSEMWYNMKISIVTVCLNAETVIRKTIDSVLNQTFSDFEYVIKDGGSKDRTLSIAQSYESAFHDKGIDFRITSCADTGPYDAMNQAVLLSRGEWVLFMNAGDWFVNPNVLAEIEKSGVLPSSDVVYGDVIQRNGALYLYSRAAEMKNTLLEMPFCHQSALVRTSLLKEHPFSTRYKICADQRFFLEMYLAKKRFSHLPFAVAVYDVDGLSSDRKRLLQEKMDILQEFGLANNERIRLLKKREGRRIMNQFIKRCIPAPVQNGLRKRAGWKTEIENHE